MLPPGLLRAMALTLAMFSGFMLAGAGALFCLKLVIDDAVLERRMIWLSWPATAAVGVLLSWAIVRAVLQRQRMVAGLKARDFDCPSCGGRLPPWDGVFRNDPDEWDCVDWIEGTPWGRMRFRCSRCRRDVWFYAWISGNVSPVDWATIGQGGQAVDLDHP